MTSHRPSPGSRSPDVIIHSSLAQNLYRRLAATGAPRPLHTSSSPSSSASSTSSTSPSSHTANHLHASPSMAHVAAAASPGATAVPHRDRTKSGGQTPREMVWVDSKERLSEMATNIRGISNALSNVALSVAVKNILIVAKLSDDELPQLTKEMVEWLLLWSPRTSQLQNQTNCDAFEIVTESSSCSEGNLNVFVEDQLAKDPAFGLEDVKARIPSSDGRIKLWGKGHAEPDAENIDLVVTLGGDGTVLYTSWLFQKMVPPTLSFGLGSLGFMTENQYEEFPQLFDEFLTNGICCTLRMRFCCTVMRTRNTHKTGSEDLMHEMREGGETSRFTSHTKDGDYTILNEVVVDRGPNPFVTMTELYGNFELLTSIKADGVVISTPTGSTAYSMSAGGSLVHPDIPAQLISPICPHTLSFRPLVVPDSMILHIGVPYDARSSAFVSFDGKARVELRKGDFLAINVSRYPFPKVLPTQSTSVSWVQQLSRTLHWNEQKRPKRYTDGSTDNWQG